MPEQKSTLSIDVKIQFKKGRWPTNLYHMPVKNVNRRLIRYFAGM